MSWNTTSPDGTKSVRANLNIIGNNFTYARSKLILDHYWDEDANNDGHHRKVEMPKITASGVAVDANNDPTALSSGQVCMLYTRTKTAAESPAVQIEEPYAYTVQDPLGTPVNHYMQLGFRAMANFTGRSSNGNCTINYSHNITSISRTGLGLYTVTFSNAMPSARYMLLGTAMRDVGISSSIPIVVAVQNAAAFGTSMTTASCKITFVSADGGNVRDPLVGMIAFIGG